MNNKFNPYTAELEPGMIVKFAELIEEGDGEARFIVIESRGDRVLVEAICSMSIKPQYNFRRSELVIE